MTPRQAAEILGCDPSHVRWLIREGRLEADRRELETGQYIYSIREDEVEREKERYRSQERGLGRPRGT